MAVAVVHDVAVPAGHGIRQQRTLSCPWGAGKGPKTHRPEQSATKPALASD